MSTNYPAGLDTTTELPNNRTNETSQEDVHPADHNNYSDAIIAIETELGTDPAGSESTVDERIAAVESSSTVPLLHQRLNYSGGTYTAVTTNQTVDCQGHTNVKVQFTIGAAATVQITLQDLPPAGHVEFDVFQAGAGGGTMTILGHNGTSTFSPASRAGSPASTHLALYATGTTVIVGQVSEGNTTSAALLLARVEGAFT